MSLICMSNCNVASAKLKIRILFWFASHSFILFIIRLLLIILLRVDVIFDR